MVGNRKPRNALQLIWALAVLAGCVGVASGAFHWSFLCRVTGGAREHTLTTQEPMIT